MSSILKALEKVETDLAHQNQGQNGARPFHRINEVSSHGAGKTSNLGKRLGVVFCVVLLAAAGWYFAVDRPAGVQGRSFLANLLGTEKTVPNDPEGSGSEKNDLGRSPETGPSATANMADKKTQTAALPANTRPKTPDVSPSSRENLSPEKPVQKDSQARPSAAPRKSASAAGQQGLPARGESLPMDDIRPRDPVSSPVPATGSRGADNGSVSSAIPIMRVSELKLHAIAWSKDPAKRMAVINNSITREGETVDGFSVVRIAQDEIVVRKDREQWRLMLR